MPSPSLMPTKAIICDLDGTLCQMHQREPFEFSKVDTDFCNLRIKNILDNYHKLGYKIILVSGRPKTKECFDKTTQWLQKNDIVYHLLLMRKNGDFRSDEIVKLEIYESEIKPKYAVAFVLDDRNRVVKMWREQDLLCLQVADGNF